ncbi:uncharacterized protein LOC131947334 isoform X1 [Physella acuta]|uniref:uncharacterized protein LOC131947334 isoform X1 n=1 Tax=Physella acuta TaxID=109671 RepID=UPI0027DE2BC3|nr:uncharacterized protein LOC131947334 isoform X1 [Physella acuta]
MAPTHFLRMINILALVCLGLISKVEGQASQMGVEFQVQFPYMPEGQPILMMNSPMLDTFDVYVTAPLSDHPVSERISRSDTTTSIVAKGKFQFGMTVFMPVSFHSAASFQAIPTSGFGAEYYVLAPKTGPSIVLISSVEENEISVHYAEHIEQLQSQFTEGLLSTIALNRKEAYIMQNCTRRTVGEKHLGAITPAKITALYSFGVIVGTCEEYEFESECQRKNVKTAGGVTAEMLIPSRTGEKQFVIPVTINEETQVINVAVGRVLESPRRVCSSDHPQPERENKNRATFRNSEGSITRINDGLDNDCDGFVNKERAIMKAWPLGILFLPWSQNKVLKIFLVLVLFSSTSTTTAAEVPPTDDQCERYKAEYPELFEQYTRPLREEKEKREQENNCQKTCGPSEICLARTTVEIGLVVYVTLTFCAGIYMEVLRRRGNALLAEIMSIEAEVDKHTPQPEHMSEDQAL